MLCDSSEVWDGVGGCWGRFKREGAYVYLRLIHGDLWQQLTQYCKAIVFQFFKKRVEAEES